MKTKLQARHDIGFSAGAPRTPAPASAPAATEKMKITVVVVLLDDGLEHMKHFARRIDGISYGRDVARRGVSITLEDGVVRIYGPHRVVHVDVEDLFHEVGGHEDVDAVAQDELVLEQFDEDDSETEND